jgi:anti-anti-sigma factor
VVVAPTSITGQTLPGLEAASEPHLVATGPGVVFDLSQVGFISSEGLGFFVKVGKRLGDQGRAIALAAPARAVDRLFRVVGLDAVLPLFKTVAEASAHVTRSATPT